MKAMGRSTAEVGLTRNSWIAIAILLPLAACGTPAPTVCAAGTGIPVRIYGLYFGRNIKTGGFVSDTDWNRFRDTVITANLPDGYTILDAEGAWAAPGSHRTVTDPTKLLIVALPTGPAAVAAVTRIRLEYQHRFAQDLVGLTVQPGCALF